MKRFTAVSLMLVLFFAAPAVVSAKSYTGAFRISVTIPATIQSVDPQTPKAIEEISKNWDQSPDVSIVQTLRDHQPVTIKTQVVR